MNELDVINRILNTFNTEDEVTPAEVSIETTRYDDMSAMKSSLADFRQEAGWLCFTDRIERLTSAENIADMDGVVLSGELCKGNLSLHIRQRDAGWTVFKIEKKQADDAGCVCIPEAYISDFEQNKSGREKEILRYDVFWKADASGAMSPFACRFAGFAPYQNTRG